MDVELRSIPLGTARLCCYIYNTMKDTNSTQTAPEMVFTMGLPGSGKSTTLGRMGLLATHQVIDPDAFKRSHPDYDPKAPELLHAWSSLEAEKAYQAATASTAGLWVVDGTGTNSDRMVRRIRQAQAMGFRCRLVYVRVSLATALSRNASRERSVPEQVIREKALDIATAFELVASVVDEVTVWDND